MQTEEQFLNSLLDNMAMTNAEEHQAKQALIDMVTGNPIEALRTGVQLAEQVLTRTRNSIVKRQEALKDGNSN